MKEREAQTPYWQHDILLGEIPLRDRPTSVRLRLHVAAERYRKAQDLVPLTASTEPRLYFHAQPYIAIPNLKLALRLFPAPDACGAIGKVDRVRQAGTHARDIGNAQAWYYPADQTVILWECVLWEGWRRAEPAQDPGLGTVWSTFEQMVLAKSGAVDQLVTPSWEPLYPTPQWRAFLRTQGYEAANHQTFTKRVRNPTGGA